MSSIDPEVLYLILTKVAASESFYGFDAAKPASGQGPGTITPRQLGEVYERITGNRVGTRLNWNTPITQLDTLLKRCGLPALAAVVAPETGQSAEAAPAPELMDALKKVRAAKWPAFSALKNLYTR